MITLLDLDLFASGRTKTVGHMKSVFRGFFLRRICSFETDFVKLKNEMKSWFLNRGYPERLIDNEMKKVKFDHYHFNGNHNSKIHVPSIA